MVVGGSIDGGESVRSLPDVLRVGLLVTNENIATIDPEQGEPRGVGVDLGRYVAAELGTAFEAVSYASPAALVAGAHEGAWDLTFFGVDPSRANDLDFGPIYLEIDLTYLVSEASEIDSVADVDRPGVRIAVPKGNVPDLFLTRTLQHAELVRLDRRADVAPLIADGTIDAYASHRGELLVLADRLPGARLLAGAFLVNRHGAAVPKGRDALLACVGTLVERAIASGLVAAAVERAGLRGVRVARTDGTSRDA